MQRQLHSDWCWAAVASSISRHFNPVSSWCQCKLATKMAKFGKRKVDCCAHPFREDLARVCNQPWYLEKALRTVGRYHGKPIPGKLSFRRIQKEILDGVPVCARIQWGGAKSGHFVLISGCTKSKTSARWLYVDDPFYGTSTWLYEEFCVNYQYSQGRWSHTYPIRKDAEKGKRATA